MKIPRIAPAATPIFYIKIKRSRRLKAFLLQLPYALDLLKSSLEAGHTLQRGMQVVEQEFAEPIGGEFRTVVEQTRLGMPAGFGKRPDTSRPATFPAQAGVSG
jgi:tight adherence protein B